MKATYDRSEGQKHTHVRCFETKVSNSWGEGGSLKTPLEQKILGVGGVQIKMSSVGGGYGYFLEPHILQRFEYHICIKIFFPFANVYHIALGIRSVIKSYSVRLHMENAFRSLLLLPWQLLIEMLGLLFEPS